MTVISDAQEFGFHFKQGGWRLGFLVARNCEPGRPGRQKTAENPSPEMDSGAKVSFTEFAKLAGVSQSHVSYYYAAWNRAAEDDYCPPAEQLSPDSEDGLRDDIDADDAESRELWMVYYRKARDSGEKSPETNHTVTRTGSGAASKGGNGAGNNVSRAVDALAKTSEQLSAKLVKVVNATPLAGEDDELAVFAEELRRTRSVLDGYCREIDRILNRIGFGDKTAEEDALTT